MNNYHIYIHTNKLNGKKYIGVTTYDPEQRWRNGSGYLKRRNSKYYQPKFARAIIKYGWDNFEHQVITVDSKEDMLYGEKYLIAYYNTVKDGYNITTGGEHFSHSEETRIKISQKLKGIQRPKGKNSYWYGREKSSEHRKKFSEALKGNKNGCKVIMKYTLDGIFLEMYSSLKEAAESAGVLPSNLSKYMHQNRPYKKYIWKYE